MCSSSLCLRLHAYTDTHTDGNTDRGCHKNKTTRYGFGCAKAATTTSNAQATIEHSNEKQEKSLDCPFFLETMFFVVAHDVGIQ